MQRAAAAVAALARALDPHARRIWIACGPGNNGGDGLLAAAFAAAATAANPSPRQLAWRREPMPDDARLRLQQARCAGVAFCDSPPQAFDLGIDALLGLGSRGLESASWRTGCGRCNRPARPFSAWTCPADSTRQRPLAQPFELLPRGPRHTLSLLTLKPGLFTADGRDAAGQVWLDRLGVDPAGAAPDAWLSARQPAGSPLRQQRHAVHKGSHGDLLVLGGQDVSVDGAGMTGAALLAASRRAAGGRRPAYLGCSAPAPRRQRSTCSGLS